MDPEWASRFSATLFWDTAPATVDPERHKRWLVTRVLEYGTLADWRALVGMFPMHAIVDGARQARSLSPKALAFICFVSGESRESFRCCTLTPSSPA